MRDLSDETEVICPYCGECFTIGVDASVEQQSYIEDCYVCCRPIQFTVRCEEGRLVAVEAARSD